MQIKTMDASAIKKCFLAGANAIDEKKERINDLNVFPVPDGDTGTNMTMTIMSAANEVAAIEDGNMKALCKAISSGSLRGARGNSGVILSQLLRGFTKEIGKVEEVDVRVLSKAFERAVESAYKAVMKPKEGTILTVARAGAEKAVELVDRTDDLREFTNSVITHMQDVLNKTPDMLPVLKDAGVVDSGGEGLLTIVRGAYDALIGKKVNSSIDTISTVGDATRMRADTEVISEADIRFGYCTEYIVMLEKEFHSSDEREFKAYLESIGDSIVCVADEDIVKIHVHTNDPGLAIQKGLEYGSLSRMKIDNMREEHNERVIKNSQEAARNQKDGEDFRSTPSQTAAEPVNLQSESDVGKPDLTKAVRTETDYNAQNQNDIENKENGFISVSVGAGLGDIFRNLGVDFIIEGGQTMNPSTEDILHAIQHINADTIFILPNNSNIILAAEQAKDLTDDKKIIVIPSTNIPQGIAAMIGFEYGASPEENQAAMTEALEQVKSGQVTYAVRDTTIDGKEIKSGDIMGLSGKTIEAVGTEVVQTTVELLEKMIDEDSELVTIYYGEDATEEEAEKIAAQVQLQHEEIDIEIQYGGQPIYYYFVSAE